MAGSIHPQEAASICRVYRRGSHGSSIADCQAGDADLRRARGPAAAGAGLVPHARGGQGQRPGLRAHRAGQGRRRRHPAAARVHPRGLHGDAADARRERPGGAAQAGRARRGAGQGLRRPPPVLDRRPARGRAQGQAAARVVRPGAGVLRRARQALRAGGAGRRRREGARDPAQGDDAALRKAPRGDRRGRGAVQRARQARRGAGAHRGRTRNDAGGGARPGAGPDRRQRRASSSRAAW